MLTLDLKNENYGLFDLERGFTGGSIDNFKGDKDFVAFLISYSLGKKHTDEGWREYAEWDGMFNLMLLDEYGYYGEKIYKIYEICGKNKLEFIRTCAHIGSYPSSVNVGLCKKTIDTNLALKNPVPFTDKSIVLSDGTIPKFSSEHLIKPFGLFGKLNEEYIHELERSLRHRINESIRENNENIPYLPELLPYKEHIKKEAEARESLKINDDYEIKVDNIYFGIETIDPTGGIYDLGFELTKQAWFENLNLKIFDYYVFRSLPDGVYFHFDNEGNLCMPDETIKKDGIIIKPDSSIRKISMTNILDVLSFSIEKLKNEPGDNEKLILDLSSILELLESNDVIKFKDLKIYQEVVSAVYKWYLIDKLKEDDNNYSSGNKPSSK